MHIPAERWRLKAVTVTAAGALMSLIVSAALALAGAMGLPGASALERGGIDMAMQAFVLFAPQTDPQPGRPGEGRFAFVDVDDICTTFAAAPATCRSRDPIPVELQLDFLRAVQNSGAKVVIVDVIPPDDEAAFNALRDGIQMIANAPGGGPWIIAPVTSRPETTSRPGVAGRKPRGPAIRIKETADIERQLAPDFHSGRLRLASIVTTDDPAAGDGVIRHYPLTSTIHIAEGSDRILPSAPFLAAMLSDDRTAAAMDCQFYPRDGCAARPPKKLQALLDFAASPMLQNRIYYTLPSLSQQVAEPGKSDSGLYLGRYDRFRASSLLEDGHFAFEPGELDGRIVILGSSQPVSEDLYMSPIGKMSGAEILLNAARTLRDFAPIKSAKPGEGPVFLGFGEKLEAAMIGAACFLPAWLLIFGLRARVDQTHVARHSDDPEAVPGAATTLRRALRKTAWVAVAILAFLTALSLTVGFEFWLKVQDLRNRAETGVLTDMLTPAFAMGLEGFAEAGKAVSNWLEGLVLVAGGALMTGVRHVLSITPFRRRN